MLTVCTSCGSSIISVSFSGANEALPRVGPRSAFISIMISGFSPMPSPMRFVDCNPPMISVLSARRSSGRICVFRRPGRSSGEMGRVTVIAVRMIQTLEKANFVRDVDYCSAAFLMVRTEDARHLGGFDPKSRQPTLRIRISAFACSNPVKGSFMIIRCD